MDIKQVYKDLTSVDIDLQKDLWNERGKGHYGEFLVFSELYSMLPGNAKIVMNAKIPGKKTEKTEIDLILLHETGIVVFEMKHYKGTIYGDVSEHTWTQYFRTAKNQTFYNPVLQNEGHIAAMRDLFPGIPIRSFIVFTNGDVDLKIKGSVAGITVCRLQNMMPELTYIFNGSKNRYSMETIDQMFQTLLPYAPIMSKPVTYKGEVTPFYKYVDAIRNDFANKTAKLAQQNTVAKRKHLFVCAGVFAALAVCVIIGTSAIARSYVRPYIDRAKAAEQRAVASEQAASDALALYEDMKHNFERVDDYQQGDYELADGVLTVSDVTVVPSENIKNAVEIDGSINIRNDLFTFGFGDGTATLVQLKDGSVKEYDLFGQGEIGIRKYGRYGPIETVRISGYSSSRRLLLTGLSVDDISYIKIKNIYLCAYPYGNVLKEGLELELYPYTENDE